MKVRHRGKYKYTLQTENQNQSQFQLMFSAIYFTLKSYPFYTLHFCLLFLYTYLPQFLTNTKVKQMNLIRSNEDEIYLESIQLFWISWNRVSWHPAREDCDNMKKQFFNLVLGTSFREEYDNMKKQFFNLLIGTREDCDWMKKYFFNLLIGTSLRERKLWIRTKFIQLKNCSRVKWKKLNIFNIPL